MIEYLSGRLLEKAPTKALLLCGGVGYGLHITLTTYEALPDVGTEASLHTYLSVREDAMILFGFSSEVERDMFVQLIGVSGVGPKTAIGMLSGMGATQLRDLISSGNSSALVSLPGIGKKSAERITLELRDRIGSIGASSGTGAASGLSGGAIVRADALAALLELGYNRNVAERSIRAALKSDNQSEESVERMIKNALREMQR
jgi:Holliday junction DNA helicase RuvA